VATAEGCAGHGEVGEELRLLGLALLDRVEPRMRSVLAGLRVEAAAAAGQPAGAERPVACEWCPVCATIALVRGEAPELGGRVADHAGALLTALRAVLDQPAQQPREPREPQTAPEPEERPERAVREPPAQPRGVGAGGGC
jgi:hypothetical protein